MLSDDELSEPSKCSLVEQRSAAETALRKRYMLCSSEISMTYVHEHDTSWASLFESLTHSLTHGRTPRFYSSLDRIQNTMIDEVIKALARGWIIRIMVDTTG